MPLQNVIKYLKIAARISQANCQIMHYQDSTDLIQEALESFRQQLREVKSREDPLSFSLALSTAKVYQK